MPNYNNGNFRDVNNYQNNVPRYNPVHNNVWNNGYQMGGYPMNSYQTNSFNQSQIPQVQQAPQMQQAQVQADDRVFVAGRLGADAYQLQPGVNVQVLWDDDTDRFYIKGYDEKGRPRVLGDFDFQPHIDSDSQQFSPDMSQYATKDDIRNMISDALKKNKNNTNNYVTMDVFNKTLSELCVGNGGKVVRSSESDA